MYLYIHRHNMYIGKNIYIYLHICITFDDIRINGEIDRKIRQSRCIGCHLSCGTVKPGAGSTPTAEHKAGQGRHSIHSFRVLQLFSCPWREVSFYDMIRPFVWDG